MNLNDPPPHGLRHRWPGRGAMGLVAAFALVFTPASGAAVRIRRPLIVVISTEPTSTVAVVPPSTTAPPFTSTLPVSSPTATAIVATPSAPVLFDPKDPRCRGKLATRALLDRTMAKASTQLARADTRLRRAEAEGLTDVLATLTAERDDAGNRVTAIRSEIDYLFQRCR